MSDSMIQKDLTVAEKRKYSVVNVQSAKQIALVWIEQANLHNVIRFGLPEVDDRYHIWRVPLLNAATTERIGEVVIDCTHLAYCGREVYRWLRARSTLVRTAYA